MSNKFIIVFDNPTKEQSDIITKRLAELPPPYKYWHWIEHAWLVSGAPDDITSKSFCDWLEQTPGINLLIYIVFQVKGSAPYWGRNNKDAWEWMTLNWESTSVSPAFTGSRNVGVK
jgi:hypothetical protein